MTGGVGGNSESSNSTDRTVVDPPDTTTRSLTSCANSLNDLVEENNPSPMPTTQRSTDDVVGSAAVSRFDGGSRSNVVDARVRTGVDHR